ncbi:MAG: hypothetical protein ACRC1Z_15800 [Waterburya sp.]
MKKPSLSRSQNELKKLLDEKLINSDTSRKIRVYEWLNENQYFVDNELFDFYLCVAQNLAAVEELGGCGFEIIKAKKELEAAAETYKQEIVNVSEQMMVKQEYVLRKSIERVLEQMLKKMNREHQNVMKISTELLNFNATLMAQQKQLLAETSEARTASRNTIWMAISTLIMTLLGLWWILNQVHA